ADHDWRCRCRADRVHPDRGRLCDPGIDWRRQDPDDRQHHRSADVEASQPRPGLDRSWQLDADRGDIGDALRAGQPPLLGRQQQMKKSLGLQSYAIIYLILLYAPIIILPMFAFNNATTVSFPLQGFTTKWFEEMLGDAKLHKALR